MISGDGKHIEGWKRDPELALFGHGCFFAAGPAAAADPAPAACRRRSRGSPRGWWTAPGPDQSAAAGVTQTGQRVVESAFQTIGQGRSETMAQESRGVLAARRTSTGSKGRVVPGAVSAGEARPCSGRPEGLQQGRSQMGARAPAVELVNDRPHVLGPARKRPGSGQRRWLCRPPSPARRVSMCCFRASQ